MVVILIVSPPPGASAAASAASGSWSDGHGDGLAKRLDSSSLRDSGHGSGTPTPSNNGVASSTSASLLSSLSSQVDPDNLLAVNKEGEYLSSASSRRRDPTDVQRGAIRLALFLDSGPL